MKKAAEKKGRTRKEKIKPYIFRELIREIILILSMMYINVRKPLKCMKIALDDNKIKP